MKKLTHIPWKITKPVSLYESEKNSLVIMDFDEEIKYSLQHRSYVVWKLLELGLSTYQILRFFKEAERAAINSFIQELERDGMIVPQQGLSEQKISAHKEEIDSLLQMNINTHAPVKKTVYEVPAEETFPSAL